MERVTTRYRRQTRYAYTWAIEHGIAKEQARAVLPEGNTLSRLYANGTLRSWVHYIELRGANGNQLEHIEIAKEVAKVISKIFPLANEVLEMNDDYMDISSYSTDTITLTGTSDTVTIKDSGFTLSGMTDNYVIDTTTIDSGIHIGGTTLYENDVKEIMVLLDIIKELDDDNSIKALYNSEKC